MTAPRLLHPGAWWLWAIGLAVAASRTTNPVLLALIIAVAGYVVAARRPLAPWSRSYVVFLKIGLVVIAIRTLFQMLVGSPIGTTVLLALPAVSLPELLAGVRIGGAVTLEALLAGFYDGLRLAAILACVGAANSLASPSRLLKSVPPALYEVGVSVVVALTFAPQLVADLDRVRASRRLRGRSVRGVRGAAGAALPVLEGAMERSITLAAAMDSRGYGRSRDRSTALRRMSAVLLLGGLVAAVVGSYGLLDGAAPVALGLPMLAIGAVLALAGIGLAGRRSMRTRYRPDPWSLPEWGVTACATVTAGAFVVASIMGVAGLTTPVDPPAWPAVPVGLVVAVAVSVLPAWFTPPTPGIIVKRTLTEVSA